MNSVLTWISNPDEVNVNSFMEIISDIFIEDSVESMDRGFFKYYVVIPQEKLSYQIKNKLSEIAALPLDISVPIRSLTINKIKGLSEIINSLICDLIGIKITTRSVIFDDMILYQVYLDDNLYYVHEHERKYIIEGMSDTTKYIGYRLISGDPLGIYNAIRYENVKVVKNLVLCDAKYDQLTQDIIDSFKYDIDELERKGYFAIEFNGVNDKDIRYVTRTISSKYNVKFVAETDKFDFYVSDESPNQFLQHKN